MQVFTRDDTEHGVEYVRKVDADAAVAAERERCMGAMDSHGRYWVENRSRIIDAVAAAGYRIESNHKRCWLAPLGPNV